ncbi:MOSC and FAD-binding oxidoreductase domain-containing protein [Streptomyces sp. NBC_01497]|uniref:MOSC and FAD-binding oxidoreductase domain-containing protein n=1 Tax=Streptomyces sp. NBC_01497 TaxID=2903885 RepID=UPI002E339AC6|nr:MOSC and FAD-binding oxidoreductase domain-containing protein [Streptomyces sp. NBC_01497]
MATLVSLNVGLPKDVPWQGRTVYTGIWKQPVSGPRRVRRLNIDGDGQGDTAGHGGEMRAVMVYQLDSYRHWAKELGRDDLGNGEFGENFTVEGLPDDEVCIGDRYRIGDAVFEVSQPRVTCYRVGMRLNEPRMPSLLVSHRRPGFYLRVITEGDVEAGQEIVKVASGPGAMTVAEVDGLLYLPGHPEERLRQAVRIGALSPGWHQSFSTMLEQGDAPATAPSAPAWAGFRPLRVVRTKVESRSVLSLWLAAEDGSPLPAASPGQYLTVRLDAERSVDATGDAEASVHATEDVGASVREGAEHAGPGSAAAPRGADGKTPADGTAGAATAGPPLVRSYSLSGRPGGDQYRISVKRESHGVASTRIHTQVHVDDLLQAAAPRGAFVLEPGSGPLVLASAGVGATPVLAMLRAVVDHDRQRPVWWLHGARDGADHAFAQEVRQLLDELPHGRLVVCYSRPRPEDRRGTDFTYAGHLDAGTLGPLSLPPDAEAYLCGPVAFMDDLTGALVAGGMRSENVRREVFGAGSALTPGIAAAAKRPPHQPEGASATATGPAVTFARSGLTVPWGSGAGATLLELAEACDVPVRWSCRTGVCHTCETSVFSGGVAYDPEPIEPPADATVLICCSRPDGDIVLDL